MHLVAPEIHVRVRVEDAGSRAQHVLPVARRPRDAERGAMLFLSMYTRPLGYPFWPPTNATGAPLLKSRFVRILLMSCSGVWISYRNPALT